MPLASILVVDGDARSRRSIAHGLRELGHDVSESANAGSAIAVARTTRPDLVVCDHVLPDLAGVELLSDIRNSEDLRSIRVLMTSDRGVDDDVVTALRCGADDFVGKPIRMRELAARVDACLRRPATASSSRVVTAGGISVDTVGHRVIVDGNSVTLAFREYRLLLFLLGNPDRVFSRQQLLAHVWDRGSRVGPRTVDVHIRRLRSLLEPSAYDRYIQTVRGSGYRFSLTV